MASVTVDKENKLIAVALTVRETQIITAFLGKGRAGDPSDRLFDVFRDALTDLNELAGKEVFAVVAQRDLNKGESAVLALEEK